eukprot:1537341-Pyramimonas_sp.AAC.1
MLGLPVSSTNDSIERCRQRPQRMISDITQWWGASAPPPCWNLCSAIICQLMDSPRDSPAAHVLPRFSFLRLS